MRLFGKQVPKSLEEAVSACRTHLLLAAGFSALINVLYLAPTIYMMQVYDRVVPTGGIMTLVWVTVLVAVALAALASLEAIRSQLLLRASLRLNRLLSGTILHRLMARSRLKPDEPSTTQAMREFDTLRQAFGGPAATALFDLPWTPLYVIVAFVIHPLLGMVVVCGGAVLVGLALMNANRTRAKSTEASRANAASYAAQEMAAEKAEVIRALGMRNSIVQQQIRHRSIGLQASTAVQFAGSRYNSIVKFVRMFMQSVALGTGAFLAVNGQISAGAIIAASVLLSRGLQPVEQMVGAWPTIVQAREAIQTLTRLFDSTAEAERQRTRLPDPVGHVELDRLVVRNPEGTAILLKNVSLTMVPGEVLGVVGATGAGKSTLARVAAGALPPDLGEIRIDHASLADWDQEALARHIGYLPQDSALLPGRISENISRFAEAGGAPKDMVDREVVRAAQLAGVHAMILGLPNGYDTELGPKAYQLSAGQAQRVALARALFGDPKILVLDEPNAALDSDGELALARAIAAKKAAGASIMIVAHRAAILRDADRLLVLQDGAIAQLGPYEEVMAALRKGATAPNVVPMKERA